MSSSTRIEVIKPLPQESVQLKELTIAWAMDNRTRRPIHVLELGAERSGKWADCSCPSCNTGLIAVNNAKTHFVRRPHFRHVAGASASGTGLSGCAIVAARMAVLRGLELQGWIDLPAREVSGSIKGLLGQIHTATAVHAAERIQLTNAHFADRTRALLTLGDGRVIEVCLIGTPKANEQGTVGAIVTIEVPDPGLAALTADELRNSLTLPGLICWRSHWEDLNLEAKAKADALAQAQEMLSLPPPELVLPDNMPSELKSETVLHYAVKQILAEGGAFLAPGTRLEAQAHSGDYLHEKVFELNPRWLMLSNVQLERRLGLIRPDLVCSATFADGSTAFTELCVEVTVTNAIHDERLDRIQRVGIATIEIDLRGLAGRITREELRELVLTGEHVKSWLFHPEFSSIQARLRSEVDDTKRAYDDATALQRNREARAAATPREALVDQYLQAVIAFLAFMRDNRGPYLQNDPRLTHFNEVKEPVVRAATALRMKGITGSDDEIFIDGQGLLAEVLSIKTNQTLVSGLTPGPAFAVLKEIFESQRGLRDAHAPILLGAASAYRLPMDNTERKLFDGWRDAARQIYRANVNAYSRDERHDTLLSVLLPELATLLLRTSNRARSKKVRYSTSSAPMTPTAMPKLPTDALGRSRLLDTPLYAPMLQGRDLERWIQDHPDAAERLGYKARK